MPITLYDLAAADPGIRFSPFCWRTRLCLLHKGLDFDTVPWRFTDKEALASTGQGRVPVIVDHANGDRWVHDSWQIALYLDEAYPDRPKLLATAAERANARLVAVWSETSVHGAAFPLILTHLLANLAEKDKAYFRTSREERFGRTLEAMSVDPAKGVDALQRTLAPAEAALAVAPNLSGDKPGYADYALAGSLMWIWVTSPVPPLVAGTAVARWFDRMRDLFGGAGRRMPVMR